MSESDDTDVLLLIPPDFFFINTSQEDQSPDRTRTRTKSVCYIKSGQPSLFGGNKKEHMSAQHFHLPYEQQLELDNINTKISQIEKNTAESEVSSFSNTTIRSRFNLYNQFQPPVNAMDIRSGYQMGKSGISPTKFIHSTPKTAEQQGFSSSSNLSSSLGKPRENSIGVLQEIDRFLDDKKPQLWSSDEDCLIRNSNDPTGPMSLPISDSQEKYRMNIEKTSRMSEWVNSRDMDPLISLSDIWENNNVRQTDGISFQEERLRRQHCEKIIQVLQSKLLEYQQKISVAIQVDRTKDSILTKQRDDISCLKSQLRTSESKVDTIEHDRVELIDRLKAEHEDMKLNKDCLEKELSQALGLASKFQDKNEMLELKVESLSKTTNDISSVYKKQIDDLELKVSTLHRSGELSNEELRKINDRLAKSKNELEKTTIELTQCKKQLSTLQNDKQSTVEKIKHQTNRVDSLEKRNKNLSDSVTELTTREKNLLKELESQRNSLKTHYQTQLEKVVEQKLKEFQAQLDSVENNLNRDARDRERLIADRAIKQLELINEKNEQEISLIIEKHSEEVELYRLQLINASKKIAEIEDKLNLYRNRRVDIAEKLHSIMEAQWQKALEILTSPSNPINEAGMDVKNLDPNKLDGVQKTKSENESFDSQPSSRFRTYRTSDRLQAYIEMLLNKSPRDLENLNEILAMPNNHSCSPNKIEKSNSNQSKPPWK